METYDGSDLAAAYPSDGMRGFCFLVWRGGRGGKGEEGKGGRRKRGEGKGRGGGGIYVKLPPPFPPPSSPPFPPQPPSLPNATVPFLCFFPPTTIPILKLSNISPNNPPPHPPSQKRLLPDLKEIQKLTHPALGLSFDPSQGKKGGVEVCGIKLRRKRQGGNERDVGLIRFPSFPVNSFWAI